MAGTATIRIVDHDPGWAGRFADQAQRIRQALGARALRVEHVGSTSVPGLAAKPVLDILLVVEDSRDEAAFADRLQTAGFALHLREPHWHQHRLFVGTQPEVNLHVFSLGCPENDRMLAFRDRLRQHPGDRDLYQRTKLALAQQPWRTVDEYAEAKTAVVEAILARAGGSRSWLIG